MHCVWGWWVEKALSALPPDRGPDLYIKGRLGTHTIVLDFITSGHFLRF